MKEVFTQPSALSLKKKLFPVLTDKNALMAFNKLTFKENCVKCRANMPSLFAQICFETLSLRLLSRKL